LIFEPYQFDRAGVLLQLISVTTGALVGLSPQRKHQAPPNETWSSINQWSFVKLSMSIKSPYWRLSGDGSTTTSYHFQKFRTSDGHDLWEQFVCLGVVAAWLPSVRKKLLATRETSKYENCTSREISCVPPRFFCVNLRLMLRI